MYSISDNPVLHNFEMISRIPRGSGNEKAVSDYIKGWAENLGLSVSQDKISNLIITKPASAGFETHPPVMLQAHLDMVCEKNNSSSHDFTKDPILLKTEGDWLMSACGTTLGADNGIGVAAAMTILEDRELKHPSLEVVFTVQEESTFAGVENVDVSLLRSRRMINLDNAVEHELIVGSCGGTGIEFKLPLEREREMPEGCGAFRIRLSGLKGGHSGGDIHRGRGNAIALLLRVIERAGLRTVSVLGGTNRLAIPREAEAVVLANEETVRNAVSEAESSMKKEYASAAPDLELTYEPAEASFPLTEESFKKLAAVIRLCPNGIVQMNGGFEGLVESSNNIGILRTDEDSMTAEMEVRGAYRSTVEYIVQSVQMLADITGAEMHCFNGYAPWEPGAGSELRTLAVGTFREVFGEQMKEIAVHAGLECGTFAERIEGLDMISTGPDCHSFHSPEERVSIISVERFYMFLIALLEKL